MTLKAQMLADVADVFMNTDEHADSVTQYPGGTVSVGNAVAQTLIVDFDKSSNGGRLGGGASREMDKGQGVHTRGYIWVSVDLSPAPTPQDRWRINGELYGVEDVGPALEGLRKIGIVKWDGQNTTSRNSIRQGR